MMINEYSSQFKILNALSAFSPIWKEWILQQTVADPKIFLTLGKRDDK